MRVAANSHAGSVNPGDAVVTKIKAKNKVGLPFLLSSLYEMCGMWALVMYECWDRGLITAAGYPTKTEI